MAKRISVTTLNASTIDILNTIRQNASYSYQSSVPEITKETDIPRVGEVLFGYPSLANEFINALVNRIALVRINSATFNNAYAALKKGYLEFGETVEEVFVNIAKAREFSVEKAEKREFKRTVPDVRSAFHAINWKVQYPLSIQNEDLRMAFTGPSGVQDLIAKLVNSLTTAGEYDEFLLFKYLIIKSVAHGKMYPVACGTTFADNAVAFRGTSNMLEFISTKYNESGVHTNTKKANQHIFMDAKYNASYDVNVLASAFNMDKADFMGHLHLIDDWTTFDNERFSEIVANSTQIEEVTASELALMADVKAVLVDDEWFQIYDNLSSMSEDYVAAGLYWNYFYNVWKTVSPSPFSNAVVFVSGATAPALPTSVTVKVASRDTSDVGTVVNFVVDDSTASLANMNVKFVQTEDMVEDAIAVHPYGSIIFPASVAVSKTYTMEIVIDGVTYSSTATVTPNIAVGTTRTFTKA